MQTLGQNRFLVFLLMVYLNTKKDEGFLLVTLSCQSLVPNHLLIDQPQNQVFLCM